MCQNFLLGLFRSASAESRTFWQIAQTTTDKIPKKISRVLALEFLPAVILKKNTKKTDPKYGIHPIVSEGIIHKIIL
jgi:hypothetical protein